MANRRTEEGPLSEPRPASSTGLWLNLSGGGFRAAIFHYGCMRRLHELGLLERVVGISATSGGAIVSALWSMHVSLQISAGIEALTGELDTAELRSTSIAAAWPSFERDLLNAVRNGVLAATGLLVGAMVSYVCGLGGLTAGLMVHNPAAFRLGFSFLLFGLLLHLCVLASLIRKEVLSEATWAHSPRNHRRLRARIRRLMLALVSPSQLRRQTMDLRMFHGFLITELDPFRHPFWVFFNAVNLEKGRQAVIGPLLESGIDPGDLSKQWKGRVDDSDWRLAEDTPLSSVVAASTAFPPVFAPVPLTFGCQDHPSATMHFLDGGVTDNAGFKLARGLALHTRPPGSFREQVRMILTLDASQPPKQHRSIVTRLQGSWRLVQIALNAQGDDLFASTAALSRLGYRAHTIGLQVGFHADSLEGLNESLKAVRTHLDGFTAAEIAALAYCGYSQIEYMASHQYLDDFFTTARSSPDSLNEFVDHIGLPKMSVERIAEGLERSSHLVSMGRFLEWLRDRGWRTRR
jgi:predicted acylesterase/phospholipase RssA